MSQATATRSVPLRRAQRGTNPTAARARLKLVQPAEAAGSSVAFVVLCGVLLIGGLITVLLLNTARAQQQYTISDLQAATSRLSASEQDLDSQLAFARAPQQVALKAQEYGMVPATNIRYVRASDHRLVGVAKGGAATTPFTVNTLPKTPATPMAELAVTSAGAAGLVDKSVLATPQEKAASVKNIQDLALQGASITDTTKSTTKSTSKTASTTAPKATQNSTTSTTPKSTGSTKAGPKKSSNAKTQNNTTSTTPTSAR